MDEESLAHPHEPETAPVYDPEGRCLVCTVAVLSGEVEHWRSKATAYLSALEELDSLRPDDFRTGQGHLTPAFREVNFRDAFRAVCRIVNGVLHGTDENGRPLAEAAR